MEDYLEEREGFEPSEPYGSPDFEYVQPVLHKPAHRCAPGALNAWSALKAPCAADLAPHALGQQHQGLQVWVFEAVRKKCDRKNVPMTQTEATFKRKPLRSPWSARYSSFSREGT